LRPRVYQILASEAERPLYCKTHDACVPTPAGEPLFPAAATRGAVYVVRDPRAVAVSSVHFMARSIDETIAAMGNPAEVFAGSTRRLSQHLRQPLLRWCEHVESWLAAPFPVHLLRYEDLLADPHAAVRAVAESLCLPASQTAIAMAVEATSFTRLQALERETGFAESPRHAAAFFREGRADGWRRVLTPAQADHIVAAHGDVIRRLGYDVRLAPLPQPIATIEPFRLRTDGPGHACCGRQRPRGGAMTTPYPRDMIGYGAEPPAAQWPGEARIALQFVINYEEGAENAILHGDSAAEAFLS